MHEKILQNEKSGKGERYEKFAGMARQSRPSVSPTDTLA